MCSVKQIYDEIGNVKESVKCFYPSHIEFCPVNWTLRGCYVATLKWYFSYLGVEELVKNFQTSDFTV